MSDEQPTPPRPRVSFDTGIGRDAPAGAADAADAGRHAALAHLHAARAAAPAPVPAAAAAPAAQTQAAADPARVRNPDLPLRNFTDLTHLPSQGKAYPEGARVRYRPYTLGESVFVENSDLTLEQTYRFILKGLDLTFDPMLLTLPDALYIGLMRRLQTLGDTKVTVNSTCPHCGGLNQTATETTALEFDDLAVPALPIRVPLCGGKHAFSPLTVADYLELDRLKLVGDIVAVYAIQCRTLPFSEAHALFENLTDARDVRMLHEVDKLLHHELKPLTIKCPQPLAAKPGEAEQTCGGLYPVNLDNVSSAFVLPFRGWAADDLSDQIEFG